MTAILRLVFLDIHRPLFRQLATLLRLPVSPRSQSSMPLSTAVRVNRTTRTGYPSHLELARPHEGREEDGRTSLSSPSTGRWPVASGIVQSTVSRNCVPLHISVISWTRVVGRWLRW